MHLYTGIEKPVLLQLMTKAFAGLPSPVPFPMTVVEAAAASVSAGAAPVIMLDLSQGPTLAFKDVGQQVVAQLLQYFLALRNGAPDRSPDHPEARAHIMIDTSGDTGPAAIGGVAGSPFIDITVLYPHGRTSEVQELQMITAPPRHSNVHVYRGEGCCDDLSSVLKEIFADHAFVRENNVININSINWARIAAQSTYYFWAYLQVFRTRFSVGRPVNVIIPTGALGNGVGCLLAQRMGLPLGRIGCATNANDVVHRTISTGDMGMGANVKTLTPAMDIQFAYNLERMLYFVLAGSTDPQLSASPCAVLRPIMAAVDAQYSLNPDAPGVQLSPAVLSAVQGAFASCVVSDSETIEAMQRVWAGQRQALCPHSAVGVYAATHQFRHFADSGPVLCVLTAHPSKFEQAFELATGEKPPQLPQNPTDALRSLPQQFEWLRQEGRPEWRAEWIQKLKSAVRASSSVPRR
jgi:threonine synthase